MDKAIEDALNPLPPAPGGGRTPTWRAAYFSCSMHVFSSAIFFVCGRLSVECIHFGIADVCSAGQCELDRPYRAGGRTSIVSGGVSPGSWGYAPIEGELGQSMYIS